MARLASGEGGSDGFEANGPAVGLEGVEGNGRKIIGNEFFEARGKALVIGAIEGGRQGDGRDAALGEAAEVAIDIRGEPGRLFEPAGVAGEVIGGGGEGEEEQSGQQAHGASVSGRGRDGGLEPCQLVEKRQ